VLLLGGIAGTWGYRIWSHSDELLHQAILDAVQKWAPQATVSLGKCRLDWLGRVHVEQFRFTLPEARQPLFSLPETVVDLDREAFLHRQELLVQQVRIIRPRVELIRTVDGIWNWKGLPPLPDSDSGRVSLPGCRLEQAELMIRLENPDGQEPTTLICSEIDLHLTPNGRRNVLVNGSTRITPLGRLNLEGRLNVDTRTGSLTGKLSGVRLDRALLELANRLHPGLLERVTGIEDRLRQVMLEEPDPASRSPFSIQGIARDDRDVPPGHSGTGPRPALPAGATRHVIPADQIGDDSSVLGLEAISDIVFRVGLPAQNSPPDVRLLLELNSGRITNTALPFPLEQLTGQIEWTGSQCIVHRLHAANGPTVVDLSGTLAPTPAHPVGQLQIRLTDVSCDDRLRDRLSPGFGRTYDAQHTQGLLDMRFNLVGRPDGRWQPEGLVVTAKKCSVQHDVFAYPVRDAVGTIRQQDRDLVIDMAGLASGRPITLKGIVREPGPAAAITLEIDVRNLPLDRTFVDACQPQVKRVLESMNLQGQIDAHLRLDRAAGEGNHFRPGLAATLHHAKMAFQNFPYAVDQLSGRLGFDGRDWVFTELRGTHGPATLTGEGSYTKLDDVGNLDLTVVTHNASRCHRTSSCCGRSSLRPAASTAWSRATRKRTASRRKSLCRKCRSAADAP